VLRIQQGETLIEPAPPGRRDVPHHAQDPTIQFEAVVTSDLLEASTPEMDDVVRSRIATRRV